MPTTPATYRAAQLLARRRMLQLDGVTVRRIEAALRTFALRLEAGIASLPAGNERAAMAASEAIVRQAAVELDATLMRVVGDGRHASFGDVLAIWQDATGRLAALRGIPTALLGGVLTGNVTMLAQWEAARASTTWKTLLRSHTVNAAQEAHTIVRGALQEGVDPAELARRLRRYVDGSQPFAKAFEDVPTLSGNVAKIDLRRLSASEREAARQMEFNARRIAVTEIHNARGEAEAQHFAADPFVEMIKWTLSPDRGTAHVPDECDVLATADYYGLGPGMYPVGKVPTAPHPFDRCEMMPVTRPTAEALANAPKPSPRRILDPRGAPIPHDRGVTPDGAARIRANAAAALAPERRRVAA